MLGGGALCIAAAVPVAMGGMRSFLERITVAQFGAEILSIDGVHAFLDAFAAQAGDDSLAKRLGAEAYFAWRGDLIHEIAPARDLETRFLQTILTRSNIIKVWRGESQRLEFTEIDPWQPTCGLYLSALADMT
ncbi:hypothetical protein OCH239_17375 [Roseivivax halodurans JCM 10272]|uniref:Uncharacterized protein n=1 Tax=Roseivivax halodurans JCM 10272 TaxID=1449350 RepID=X7E9G7_9RHOB|nr:hypothetical protein OCH239_17375 [Roseivivax halodurans JCM 10272]